MMRRPLDIDILNRIKKLLEMSQFLMLRGSFLIGEDFYEGSASIAFVEHDDIKAQTARFVLAYGQQFLTCGPNKLVEVFRRDLKLSNQSDLHGFSHLFDSVYASFAD